MNILHLNGKIQNKKVIGNGMIIMKMILVMQVNKIGVVKYLKDKKMILNQKNIIKKEVKQ